MIKSLTSHGRRCRPARSVRTGIAGAQSRGAIQGVGARSTVALGCHDEDDWSLLGGTDGDRAGVHATRQSLETTRCYYCGPGGAPRSFSFAADTARAGELIKGLCV